MSRHEGESRAPAPTAWASAYPARGPGAAEGSGVPAGTRPGPESRDSGPRGDRSPKRERERERRPLPWLAAAALSWAWSRRRGGRAAGGFALSWGGRGGGEAAGPVTGGSLALGTHTGRRGLAGRAEGNRGAPARPSCGGSRKSPARLAEPGRGRAAAAGERGPGPADASGVLETAGERRSRLRATGGKAPRLGQPSPTGARPGSR